MGYPQDFTLADGKIVVGNSSNVAKHVAVTGDVTLANTGATTVTDFTIASEARGDMLRRGASTWDRFSAKTSGQILVGDGTDVVSVAVSGQATLTSAGAISVLDNANDGPAYATSTTTLLKEDFLGAVLNTTDSVWKLQDTSAAGTPTLAIVDDAADGQFQLKFDAQNEVQTLTLYFGDTQNIPVAKGPVMIWRAKVDGTVPADGKVVMGFASARNATLDDIATNVWIRLDTSNTILLESDDTATDNDDKSSGQTMTASTLFEFKIDASTQSNITFWRRTTLGGAWTQLTDGVTTFTWAGSTDKVQPYFEIQKNSADTLGLQIDYVKVYWTRT